jgi:hypothetical protein
MVAALAGCSGSPSITDPTADRPALDRSTLVNMVPTQKAAQAIFGSKFTMNSSPNITKPNTTPSSTGDGNTCQVASSRVSVAPYVAGLYLQGGGTRGNQINWSVVRFASAAAATKIFRQIQIVAKCVPKSDQFNTGVPGAAAWKKASTVQTAYVQRGRIIAGITDLGTSPSDGLKAFKLEVATVDAIK